MLVVIGVAYFVLQIPDAFNVWKVEMCDIVYI